MKGLPENPQLYEINCRVWLAGLSRRAGRRITLGQVPQREWELLRSMGMDLVWLMGVWLPSPQGIEIARNHPDLRQAYRQALPDFTPEDVIGSPYAVADYRLNPSLGTESDLIRVREALHRAGLGLVLDFVPNHTARDHPWVGNHPERYVHAESSSGFRPAESFPVQCSDGKTRWVAHGRDPYFPAWTDTAQIFPLGSETRSAVSEELLRIGGMCDGLRCDMAMLVQNRVFEQTWKAWMESRGCTMPEGEYWPAVLGPLKAEHPDFLLMAEVYWGLEPDLLRLGFDYVYDKAGYDRLRALDTMGYKHGLLDEGDQLGRKVRFLENHDEDRLGGLSGEGAAELGGHSRHLPGVEALPPRSAGRLEDTAARAARTRAGRTYRSGCGLLLRETARRDEGSGLQAGQGPRPGRGACLRRGRQLPVCRRIRVRKG